MLCHYSTVVTPLSTNLRAPFLLVTGRSRLFSAARARHAGPPNGRRIPAKISREAVSVSYRMARVVVAIDAGTTGVRALAVDEQARVADVAYRELTQHFPRPGWVEHDPAEIWDAVRATLAEVGARLAERGRHRGGHRHHQPARDAGGLRPLDRTAAAPRHRLAGPPHRALCAELTEAGHLPFVRATTGLVLDPYFSATKAAWLLRHGDLALAADDPNLSFCTVDSWVLWNLTGGRARRHLRHRPLQRQPHPPARYGHALLVPRALRPLRRARRTPCPRCGPSAGRFGTAALGDLGPASAVLDGVPVSGVLGDQQAALFGQACFEPGMVKVTYGTGSFALANAGTRAPAGARRAHRQLRLGPGRARR